MANISRLIEKLEQGKYRGVIDGANAILNERSDAFDVWIILGRALSAIKDNSASKDCYKKAILLRPDCVSAMNSLGNLFASEGNLSDAIFWFEKALEFSPDSAILNNNLGNALRELGLFDDAFQRYQKALSVNPQFSEAHNNLGAIFSKKLEWHLAERHYTDALRADSKNALAHFNLGNLCRSLGRHMDAISHYQRALTLDPGNLRIQTSLLYHKQCLCDFEVYQSIAILVRDGKFCSGSTPPFMILSWLDDPLSQLICARNFARHKLKIQGPDIMVRPPNAYPRRIKIGYFGADFYDHATMYLISGLFRHHNKSKFEVFIFSYGGFKHDSWTEFAIAHADTFHDVADLSDKEIYDLAKTSALDIAIDLKGFTKNNRTEIFRLRLAPVQISYLGYPGSLGSTCMDYVVADNVVIPSDASKYFDENIIRLPHCYQPNDNRRVISQKKCSRFDAGIPENAFVFCNFNSSYKISDKEFGIWMRILKETHRSVLWLLVANRYVENNLRDAALKYGVDPSRLIFAEILPHAEHLARLRLADLFVDTFNVTAHTTASDALWAGLPLVTKCGNQFSSRVAASILMAAGLPELVTYSESDYEAVVIELAANPENLKAIKTKLSKAKFSAPLFDTERYTLNFERGLEAAYQNYFHGKKTQDIWVVDA